MFSYLFFSGIKNKAKQKFGVRIVRQTVTGMLCLSNWDKFVLPVIAGSYQNAGHTSELWGNVWRY